MVVLVQVCAGRPLRSRTCHVLQAGKGPAPNVSALPQPSRCSLSQPATDCHCSTALSTAAQQDDARPRPARERTQHTTRTEVTSCQ